MGALLVVAAILAACAGVVSPPRHTVTGSFTLIDSLSFERFGPFAVDGIHCAGHGGYGDIGPGTGVVLKDGDGRTLAVGQLGAGVPSDSAGSRPFRCAFTFTLTDVPEVPFYALEVSHRGASSYSLADIKALNWTAVQTLDR